jgi:hypothetical protein
MMASMPMYFPPDPFNLQDAVMCSTLVDASYDMYTQWVNQDKPDADKFQWNPPKEPAMQYSKPIWGAEEFLWFFKDKEPFSFVATADDGKVYLVFRGTESAEDWIYDADIEQKPYDLVPGYGEVHKGFLDLYKSMSAAVIEALNKIEQPKCLYITGHSLGSGLSTLAVPDVITHTDFTKEKLPVLHYNLASPRVGNPEFASVYNVNKVPTYRIVNTCDIVPQVPPSVLDKLLFEHIGTPVDYTAQYGSLSGNHNSIDSYHYALTHTDQPQGKA